MRRMQTLAVAHHDGSALYVEGTAREVGDDVVVRVRTPAADAVDRVWLRTVQDGEPVYVAANVEGDRDGELWYSATLHLHNPLTHYRFMLGSGRDYRWLNAAGISRRDVTDAHDFAITTVDSAPGWLRDSVVYQVFPDRFAPNPEQSGPSPELPAWAMPMSWGDQPSGTGRGAAREIFGGTLAGVESRLDHLESLGVTTVYLTPFFPGRSNHRYDASTFDCVDPLLGGDGALASLSAAVHARGMRIMGDLTTNHTGAGHDWFSASQADSASPESAYYYWNEAPNDYVSWLGHRSLPKLNYSSAELRERMLHGTDSPVRRWLSEPYSLDGWRIDVANMTGRLGAQDVNAEIATELRASVALASPDAAVVAEHCHDYVTDLRQGAWDATMNYAGFMRPVWQWLASDENEARFFDAPVTLAPRVGCDVAATMRDFAASIPWSVSSRNWNLLSTHDTARIRTIVGSHDRHLVGAALLFTYPGTPFIFAGDEGALEGINGEQSRATMPWDDIDGSGPRWDEGVHAEYRALGALRREHCALRHGGMRWVITADDALAFERECHHERLLVLVARAPWGGADLTFGAEARDLENVYGGMHLAGDSDSIAIPGDGPTAQVWRLHAR